MAQRFIVVFKKHVSQATIDEQADEVNQNGGRVEKKFDSFIIKGFSAEIPDAYLSALQSSLQADDSPISYIEPDSTVTTQVT